MSAFLLLMAASGVCLIWMAQQTQKREFVAPCDATVSNQDGRPITGIRVDETWNAYSFDLSGGGDLLTDDLGRVHFTEQSATHSLFFWYFMPVFVRLNYGVHASFGTYANVSVPYPVDKYEPLGSDGFSCSDSECVARPIRLEIKLSAR